RARRPGTHSIRTDQSGSVSTRPFVPPRRVRLIDRILGEQHLGIGSRTLPEPDLAWAVDLMSAHNCGTVVHRLLGDPQGLHVAPAAVGIHPRDADDLPAAVHGVDRSWPGRL